MELWNVCRVVPTSSVTVGRNVWSDPIGFTKTELGRVMEERAES